MTGLPSDMDDKNVEGKVMEVFSNISCDIDTDFIEACHRLKK